MMNDNIKDKNPFAGLFSTIDEPKNVSHVGCEKNEDVIVKKLAEEQIALDKSGLQLQESIDEAEKNNLFNELIADVFGLILHNNDKKQKNTKQLVFIDTESLDQAVFERLFLAEPKSLLLPKENVKGWNLDMHVLQTEILLYLFESYCRLKNHDIDKTSYQTITNIRKIIVCNAATALQEPNIFDKQEVHFQFVSLFNKGGTTGSDLTSFVNEIVEYLCSENKGSEDKVISTSFTPILDIIYNDVVSSTVIFKPYWFCILQVFASLEPLAKLIIKYSGNCSTVGTDYATTLLGSLLCLSCLPKIPDEQFVYFDKPFQQQNSTVDGNIWTFLDSLSDELHKVFSLLLKCSREVRHLTLLWLGDCLHMNAIRGKLGSTQDFMGIIGMKTVSDGFMLNLGNVLLRLSKPFCFETNDPKILKVDPTYCGAETENNEEARERGIHMKGMHTETCLLPTSEGEKRPIATSFSFVTECFYLTHKALDLGYRVILEKLLKISQDLARIQRLFNETRDGANSEVNEFISNRMETEMTKYLSYRASLLTPKSLSLLAKFYASTAFWLMQVNVDTKSSGLNEDCYAPNEFKVIIFPLSKIIPQTLRSIPEFIVENIISFLCFLRRWSPNTFEEQGPNFLNPILTQIVALMESPDRLYNPHLRARLAEGLESLLPNNDEVHPQSAPSLGTFHRQKLFVSHPHKQMIVPNLLHVFVSIEMTGQSVEFEQKFNYRRPMYTVMTYLWKLQDHRNKFKQLAQEAEADMEAVKPPLFLRFINLLMNDAVFLLDEALSNIAQLRRMVNGRDNGEWNTLSQQERQQQTYELERTGMIARFDNILGRETINTLKTLTSEIKSIFCHSTIVDRIVAMLNYLLLQLVGPNKNNLKVKDKKEYDFDPAMLVLSICEIYINLSKSESFTLAVSQDGRSYKPNLFKLAEDVLIRIGGVSILEDLSQFAKRVEEAAAQKKKEDEIYADAPDEFLDPIMSTLMLDPVILPSSHAVVDRQTIARHLLSDQTDPFNRSHLTMDMVESDINLKSRIQEWISKKKLQEKHAKK